MQIAIDAKTGEATRDEGGGVVGFCSWKRLAELFRDAKEVRDTEELVSYRIDWRGITYRVRSR
jgi:hypothetical protein